MGRILVFRGKNPDFDSEIRKKCCFFSPFGFALFGQNLDFCYSVTCYSQLLSKWWPYFHYNVTCLLLATDDGH